MGGRGGGVSKWEDFASNDARFAQEHAEDEVSVAHAPPIGSRLPNTILIFEQDCRGVLLIAWKRPRLSPEYRVADPSVLFCA
jgi:hypothetical protein